MTSIFLALSLLIASPALAGGTHAAARITSVSFNQDGNFVFEFEWVEKASETYLPTKFRKHVFEYMQKNYEEPWPFNLKWKSESVRSRYPLSDIAKCQNMILEAYVNKKPMNLGQMGLQEYGESKTTPNAGKIFYAKVIPFENEEPACYLQASDV